MIKDYSLYVITNSLMIAQELTLCPHISLILIGGNFHQISMSFLGAAANQALSNYYVDKAFVSCRSLSQAHGISAVSYTHLPNTKKQQTSAAAGIIIASL